MGGSGVLLLAVLCVVSAVEFIASNPD